MFCLIIIALTCEAMASGKGMCKMMSESWVLDVARIELGSLWAVMEVRGGTWIIRTSWFPHEAFENQAAAMEAFAQHVLSMQSIAV